MRNIRKIIVHASGHAEDDFRRIDIRHRKRGLKKIGFHYVISESGILTRGRPLTEVGAHCLGYNADSVGVCLCGEGLPSESQMRKLHGLMCRLARRFPNARAFRVGELDPWSNDSLRITLNERRCR